MEELRRHPVRLVVLDIGLPGIDGFEVCRRLRARTGVPILILSARDDEVDRVAGLEAGADDYVVKPFSPRELVARVKAILRRAADGDGAGEGGVLAVGEVAARPRRAHRDRRRRAGRADRHASSTCWRRCSPTPAWCSAATACLSWPGAGGSRAGRAPSTSTSPSCAPSSAGPSLMQTVRGAGYKAVA